MGNASITHSAKSATLLSGRGFVFMLLAVALLAGPVLVAGAAHAAADLVITSGAPLVSPSPAVPGEPVHVSSYTVKNQGTTSSGTYQVGFYISTDSVITSSDTFLGYPLVATPTLGPGEQHTVGGTTITLPLPASLSPGTYYVGILADWNRKVTESNEANNYVSTQITVGSAAAPDLVITTGASVTPTTVAAGGTVTLSDWTVENQGAEASGSFSNGFYLSTNAQITSSDTFLSENSNTSLAAGADFTWGGATLTIPAGTTPGTYHIGILVDSYDDVAESDETNNYVSTLITVEEASMTLPLPSGVSVYEFLERELPLTTFDASTCEPVGVGDLTTNVLSMRIGLPLMEAAVDVYFAIYSEALSPDIFFLVTEANALVSFADGLVPWRDNVTGPLDEPVFGDIPTFFLPEGTYYLYLAVVPVGAAGLDDTYLWTTSFVVEH